MALAEVMIMVMMMTRLGAQLSNGEPLTRVADGALYQLTLQSCGVLVRTPLGIGLKGPARKLQRGTHIAAKAKYKFDVESCGNSWECSNKRKTIKPVIQSSIAWRQWSHSISVTVDTMCRRFPIIGRHSGGGCADDIIGQSQLHLGGIAKQQARQTPVGRQLQQGAVVVGHRHATVGERGEDADAAYGALFHHARRACDTPKTTNTNTHSTGCGGRE